MCLWSTKKYYNLKPWAYFSWEDEYIDRISILYYYTSNVKSVTIINNKNDKLWYKLSGINFVKEYRKVRKSASSYHPLKLSMKHLESKYWLLTLIPQNILENEV